MSNSHTDNNKGKHAWWIFGLSFKKTLCCEVDKEGKRQEKKGFPLLDCFFLSSSHVSKSMGNSNTWNQWQTRWNEGYTDTIPMMDFIINNPAGCKDRFLQSFIKSLHLMLNWPTSDFEIKDPDREFILLHM